MDECWGWILISGTVRPGEASRAATKFHAAEALHGRRMTRACVVTRRNSLRIAQVVYQASAHARCRSSQSRQAV
jgi:hypothetical protein